MINQQSWWQLPCPIMACTIMAGISFSLFQSLPSQAATLTFDDLPNLTYIPNGYGGFDWENFGVLDGVRFAPSGYNQGVISRSNIVFNDGGRQASLSQIGDAPFTFNSAYFTSAWYYGLRIHVQGWADGRMKYETLFEVSTEAPTFMTFNFEGIDALTFFTSGGLKNTAYAGDGKHFAMDNFTYNEPIVPDVIPSPTLLPGLVGLFVGIRRSQRRAGDRNRVS